jgi:ribosomal protein S18 acetylase RimI-like enzyme
MLYYDRVPPHCRGDIKLSNEFAKLYIVSFNDPNGAYEENNTIESVINEVWNPHIKHGRISLAFDNDKVVGLACVEPIELSSPEESAWAKEVFTALGEHNVRQSGLPIWYFSELAVYPEYRNTSEHIGSSLIRFAMDDLRARDEDGSYSRDNKLFTLTRTDAYRSMSINAFKREGFTFLPDCIQRAEDSAQVVDRGGKSVNKIWGYDLVRPLGW